MKKIRLIVAALAGALCAHAACAQSSVTLYGLLDAGLSWVSNQGGHGVVKFDDGISVPSFFGLRGSEDLGGGLAAIFDLESQFTLTNGAQIPAGGIFGRNAWVGLKSARLGTLTLGNQFDFMNDALTISHNAPQVMAGGLYNYPAGPFQKLLLPYPASPNGSADWDRTGQQTIGNALKYVSPSLGGLRVGAMYAFGGTPGDFHTGSAFSAGLNYDQANFGVGAAYTSVAYGASAWADGTLIPAETVRNWGVGGHYVFGPLSAVMDFTTVHNMGNGAAIWQVSAGGAYAFTPTTALGFDYTYMKGNDVLDGNHANQFGATLDYALSKRTTVYLAGLFQFANRGANALFNGIYSPDLSQDQSSTNRQAILRVGMRTFF